MDFSRSSLADWTVLAVFGRVDAHSAPELEAAAGGELAAGTASLVLDLAGVPYLSSAGLRVLLALHKRVAESQGALVVAAPTPAVAAVLEVSGFSSLLRIVASLDELGPR